MAVRTAIPLAFAAGMLTGVGVLLGLGFALDRPSGHLEPSDAIIVISGDEDMARFREGLRLYAEGWGSILIFSGAARDDSVSNAQVMREIAVAGGVPEQHILVDHEAVDTLANARNTLQIMQENGLASAIVVTSPYHLWRAQTTFGAVYAGSGIQLLSHSAPDSAWRKLTWWLYPETRRLTFSETSKMLYILATGRHH